jgi:hypothetical protein
LLWGIANGRIVIVGLPKADMPQYLFDDIFFLDKTDDAHRCLAFWTDQGIDLVNFLDQPRPAPAKLL